METYSIGRIVHLDPIRDSSKYLWFLVNGSDVGQRYPKRPLKKEVFGSTLLLISCGTLSVLIYIIGKKKEKKYGKI